MKRLIGAVCAAMILMQTALLQLPVSAAEAADAVAEPVEIGLLADLGILAQSEADITEKLTYAELARIGYMIYMAGEADENTDFLKAASEIGLISADAQGDVPLNEAVKVLLRSVGFISAGKDVEEKLFTSSLRMKIIHGVSVKDSSAITLGEACKLAENTLMEDNLVFNGVEFTFSDRSVLEEVFRLEKVDGIIFPGKMYDMEDDVVLIDGAEYKTKKDFSHIAGHKVRAYVDRDENVLSVDEEYFVNEIYMISANDIKEIGDKKIEFTNGNGKTTSESLSADVIEVYNGKVQEYNSADFDINNGYITLIRTPGSGAYNVAVIKQYDILVAGGVGSNIIYDFNGLGMSVNLEEKDVEVTVTLEGNAATVGQIKKYDVLLISYSKDRKQLSVEIVRNTKKGIVTAMNDDIIEIDEETYVKTAYFKQFAKKVSLGEKVELMLDGAGLAVGFRQNGNGGKQYGFFMGMGKDNFGNKVEVKLLTDDGTIQIFNLADKVKLNGKSVRKQASELETAFKTLVECGNGVGGATTERLVNDYVYQVIIYSLNEDEEISYIDTAMTSAEEEDIEKENQLTLDAYLSGVSGESPKYRTGSMQFVASVGLTAGTKIFYVPDPDICNKFDEDGNLDEDARNIADDEDYEVPVTSPFSNDARAKIHAYCVSRGGVAEAVVVYNQDLTSTAQLTSSDASLPVFILTKVRCGLDENDDNRYILQGYEKGVEKTYYMSEEFYKHGGIPDQYVTDYGYEQRSPQPGDLLQVKAGTGNEVLAYAIRYSGTENKRFYWYDDYNNGKMSIGESGEFTNYAGYVYDQDENGIVTVEDLSTLENKRIAMKSRISAVYIYDLEENTVTKGDVNSVISYVASGYNASRVFLDGNYGDITQMIIFTNREDPLK